MKFHAITTDTPKQIIFDAGVVYRNFVSPQQPGTLLGATRGGSEFNLNIEVREIEADGIPGPVKGFKRITRVEANLTVNMLALNKDNLKRAIVGGVVDDGSAGLEGYSVITAQQITDESYFDNLALVARTGTGKPAIILIENALADGSLSISLADDDEANPSVVFVAHFDPETLESAADPFAVLPFKIAWPEGEAVAEGSTYLSSLAIGTVPLEPIFSRGRLLYTAETPNESDKITVETADNAAVATITVNGEGHTNKTAAIWEEDVPNTVVVEVTNGDAKRSYVVVVTYTGDE